MEITLKEIVDINNILCNHVKDIPKDTPNASRVSFKVAKFIHTVDPIIKSYNESIETLRGKYFNLMMKNQDGSPILDESGNYMYDADTETKFSNDISSLNATIETIDIKFLMSELSDTYNFSAMEWFALMPIVNDDAN